MKKLELNKILEMKANEEGTELGTYALLIRVCLNAPPGQGGFTPDEMRKRMRILDVLEKSTTELILEDSDVIILQRCVKTHKWIGMHKDILMFVDDIENMQKVEEEKSE